MSYIHDFIKQYQSTQNDLSPHFESDILGLLKEVSYKITNEKFSPSPELKISLKNLTKKAKEPLKLGIMGARDNGKSTFINTILKNPILPSNQIHSKKTYIISYGHSRSIIAHRKDKTAIGLNTLSLNTLTQEELEKISYFEVKFPIAMLKEFHIYKYPDIDLSDQEAFSNALKHIEQSEILIWLNRIDDLANAEELNALKSHIAQKSRISLCVLTHIDVLEKSEDIIPTLNFAKEHFGEVFSDILPISAMIFYRELGIDEKFFLQKELQKLYDDYSLIKSQDHNRHQELLCKAFEAGSQNVGLFYENLPKIPQHLQNQQINFDAILNQLERHLIPEAKKQKEKAIQENLLCLVEKIKKNYTQIIGIYSKLLTLIQNQIQVFFETFANLEAKTLDELDSFFKSQESDRRTIIATILQHTHPEKTTISLQNPNFVQLLKGKKDTFITYRLDTQNISQELLDPKSKPYRTYKALNHRFSKLATTMGATFEKSIDDFSAELKKWQAQNEFIKKKDAILSDFSYNNLRAFASKIYENIVLDFIECLLRTEKDLQVLFCKITSQLKSTRKPCIKYAISALQQRFYEDTQHASTHYAKQAPTPNKAELETIIDEFFSIREYARTLLEEEDSLGNIFKTLNENIATLQKEKLTLVEKRIDDLNLLRTTIDEISTHIEAKINATP
ncbi:dynamin family protein [Helicobacter sp. 11S02596-1]|uniref:dynamin family protein n=1 Tax=Helicobacter sp. 11S02596-1 TaxID=1476194 RepID=UPI000BA7314F|nr:dynamin family protein [Helicobacter sp. 11S02596-1]PAF42095.1 hypothetical protein BJI48_07220 [Helicobacter sp. 11S02596-1]